ncbi:MAG: hypothetical protein FD122_3805 [Stygiobacter sp.]|nr:MAG: hypothetical protein FD122_3805 [Stygiobacter sp.]
MSESATENVLATTKLQRNAILFVESSNMPLYDGTVNVSKKMWISSMCEKVDSIHLCVARSNVSQQQKETFVCIHKRRRTLAALQLKLMQQFFCDTVK